MEFWSLACGRVGEAIQGLSYNIINLLTFKMMRLAFVERFWPPLMGSFGAGRQRHATHNTGSLPHENKLPNKCYGGCRDGRFGVLFSLSLPGGGQNRNDRDPALGAGMPHHHRSGHHSGHLSRPAEQPSKTALEWMQQREEIASLTATSERLRV